MSTLREIAKVNGKRKVRVNVRYTFPEERQYDCLQCSLVLQGENRKGILYYDKEKTCACLIIVSDDSISSVNHIIGQLGIGGDMFDGLEFGNGEVGITLYIDQLMSSFKNHLCDKLLSVTLQMNVLNDDGHYSEKEKISVEVEVNSGCENYSEGRRFVVLDYSYTLASYKVFDTEEDGERWFTTDCPVELMRMVKN